MIRSSFCLFDVFEIAVGLIDQLVEGEGVAILIEDVLEINELMLIDHAEEKRLFLL